MASTQDDTAPNTSAIALGAVAAQQDVLAAKTKKSQWWRAVLGEYPTGVALITGRHPDSGESIGMVVGTFAAVSEEPPIISFMPSSSSYTWGLLRRSGSFCVNVLGAGHEALCRAFARGPEERFTTGEWLETASGDPRLADALAWFDAGVRDVVPAGDHDIALGDVRGFGVGAGDAGMPLIFLKGGYGTFTIPSLEFSPRGVGGSLRQAEAVRKAVDSVAAELGLLAFIATVVKDSIVVLAAANVGGAEGAALVGQSFPFAAPIAPVFAAWSAPDRRKVWEESSRHLLGVVDRPFMEGMLERVRERGYAVSVGDSLGTPFDAIVGDPDSKPSDYSRLWAEIDRDFRSLAEPETLHEHVHAIQVPVFNADGVTELELFISGFDLPMTPERFGEIRRRAVAAAARLSEEIGGRVPEGYPRGLLD